MYTTQPKAVIQTQAPLDARTGKVRPPSQLIYPPMPPPAVLHVASVPRKPVWPGVVSLVTGIAAAILTGATVLAMAYALLGTLLFGLPCLFGAQEQCHDLAAMWNLADLIAWFAGPLVLVSVVFGIVAIADQRGRGLGIAGLSTALGGVVIAPMALFGIILFL